MWLALVLALGCGGSVGGPSSGAAPASDAPAVEAQQVDIAAFHAKHAAGEVGLLLDVRTPGEYAAGHVPGAVNLPLDQLDGADVGKRVPPGQPVYVICEVGGRSARAASLLAGHGVPVVDVAGGTRAWKAAGHALE